MCQAPVNPEAEAAAAARFNASVHAAAHAKLTADAATFAVPPACRHMPVLIQYAAVVYSGRMAELTMDHEDHDSLIMRVGTAASQHGAKLATCGICKGWDLAAEGYTGTKTVGSEPWPCMIYNSIFLLWGCVVMFVLLVASVPLALLSWAVFWVAPAVVLLGGQVLFLAWLLWALDIIGLCMRMSEAWFYF